MSRKLSPDEKLRRHLVEMDAARVATNLNAMRVSWVDFRRGTINAYTLRLLLDRNVDAICKIARMYE